MNYTLPLARLIDEFQKLPGVGPKSAQRLAFHVLKQPDELARSLAHALLDAKEKIGFCESCFNFSSQSPCEICSNTHRKAKSLCVVSEPRDLYALERTNEYQGYYHVLQGLISPLDGVGPDDLKIKELIQQLGEKSEHIEEVILALPPSIEGDTTSLYLGKLLKPFQTSFDLKVSRIAFGLPVGGDLEYADTLTITRALQGRQLVS